MSSAKRQLEVIELFTIEKSAWSVEEIAHELNFSVSNCYRYVKNLCQSGWLDPVAGKSYVLGPAFIEKDWLIRATDPVLDISKPILAGLSEKIDIENALLLSRVYHDSVMCIHQEISAGFSTEIQYQRGRSMPLYIGSLSKVILSNLPIKIIKRVHEKNQVNDYGVNLGTWDAFRTELRQIKKVGYCVSRGMLFRDTIGVAAPILTESGSVLGAVSIVANEKNMTPIDQRKFSEVIKYTAKEIGFTLSSDDVSMRPTRGVAKVSPPD